MKKIFLMSAICLCHLSATTVTAQTAREEIALNKWLAGSNYLDYDRQLPDFRYTKAPKGYVPFYFSHYGRHGSRWLPDQERYDWVQQQFVNTSNLTALGKKVRRCLSNIIRNARRKST